MPASATIEARSRAPWRQLAALLALTKPRLGAFSVLTAMAAYVATDPGHGGIHAAATLAGAALAAGGALSLNQWWERGLDARMRRTCARPLPQRQIAPPVALAWSLGLGAAGVGVLAGAVNASAAAIAAATIVIYGLVYTPLKRRTRWATEVGAISGALPPLLGSAAAGHMFSAAGSLLAAVLLCWQMPHFFAIGWMHRDDYRAAGFPLLPAVDATGARTSIWSGLYTAALVTVSILPWMLGYAGVIYGAAAVVGGALFLRAAIGFIVNRQQRDAAARRLFVVSIVYLPLVLGGLLIDRLV